MFEDLTNNSRKFKSYESDYRKKCPYCGSYTIAKTGKKAELDDTWTQECSCNSCSRYWKFHYTEDFSKLYAELEKPNRHKVF